MLPSVLASTAILQQTFRRFRWTVVVEAIGAAGMLPLVLFAPRQVWVQLLLGVLVLAYLSRKVYQLVHAHFALKQLRMEEQFVRSSYDPVHLRRCLHSDDHLWMRSRILLALRAVLAHPLPDLLLAEEKKRRAHRYFSSAFRHMRPSRRTVDLPFVCGLLLLLAAAPTIPIELGALVFQAGLLAVALSLGSAVALVVTLRKMRQTFDTLLGGLAAWSLSEHCSDAMEHAGQRAYSHTLLYRSRPWFASPAPVVPSGDGARHVFDDQAVPLPSPALQVA